MKLDLNTVTTGLVVLLVLYLSISMVSGATGGKVDTSLSPALASSLGNKTSSSDGDMMGVYSANLTGGIKLNYPWPLHDGPGFNLDASF